jgi:hypothetical protein
MSDPVNFLISDVAVRHYCYGLQRKFFNGWKKSLSKYSIVPASNASLITACFTWMRRSFCTNGCDEIPAHLFPFYAAIEGDQRKSEYLLGRLRGYMIDKLEVPAHNLPLLFHAVAIYDARQLTRFFFNWRSYYNRCRELDQHAKRRRRKRYLRLWKLRTNAAVVLRHRHNILRRANAHRSTRSTYTLWYGLLQAIRYRRDVQQPRTVRSAFLHLVRNRVVRQFQHVVLRNGTRFDLHKRLLWGCHVWLRRLNTVPTHRLVSLPALCKWLLELVHRNWLESQELRDIYISAFGGRSQYFRCHRFIACLADERVHAALLSGLERKPAASNTPGAAPATPTMSRSPAAEYPSSRYFDFSTPSRPHAAAHVSFNTIPQYVPTAYTAGTLHATPLDATVFTPEANSRHASPLRSVSSADRRSPSGGVYRGLRSSAAQSPAAAGRASPSPTRTSLRHLTAGAASKHAAIMTVAGALRKQNLTSRLAQGLLQVTSRQFLHYRSLLVALNRWMHRVPQIKLDSPDTFAIFFTRPGQQQALQNLLALCAAVTQYPPVLWYVRYKALCHALHKWLYRARRRRFLRTRAAHLRRCKTALRQTQAFGAWLVTTARFQQLRRTANRIWCNHFKRELWRAWFAWQHYYERTVLIRANNREQLRKRNEEMERFLNERGEKRTFQAQYSVLRDWSLVVKDRKRARQVMDVWRNTVGRAQLRTSWRRWKLHLSYEVIATAIKRVWRGFRVRKMYYEPQYRYLQRFRYNLPVYRLFRQIRCLRKVFGVLKLHCAQEHDFRDMYMRRFFLRRAVKHLSRNAHLRRRFERAWGTARVVFTKRVFRSLLKRVRRRVRRYEYLHMLTRAHMVSCQVRVLNLWKAAMRRYERRLYGDAKCRRNQLRRGWRSLRRNCRIATRIRRWRTHRLRVCAKALLRQWYRKVAHRTLSHQHSYALYQRRRFRTWFRWWWLQTVRHSKRLRTGPVDQRKVFFLKIRGGRHFQVVRGMISSRVRWYMKKFIDFTSFRRRNRALLHTLGRTWHKKKLSEAFQRLMLESHRNSRERRRLRSTLGAHAADSIRRSRRREGTVADSGSQRPTTSGLLGGMSAPRGSAPPPGGLPLRLPSGSLLFPKEVQPGPAPRVRAPSEVSVVGANSLFKRLSRRQMHQNIRHVVSRHVPVTRAELRKRLQDNSTHTGEHCMCQRGFRLWLQFTRYNRRNKRACKRIDQGFWSVTLDNALKHLYTKLLVTRRMKFRAKRVLTALRTDELRLFIRTLYRNSRRRVKSNRAILKMDARWSAKFRKRFFTRMYTICFFRRFARKLKCVRRLKTEVKAAVKRLRFVAWHRLRSPAALAIKKMDLKKKKLGTRSAISFYAAAVFCPVRHFRVMACTRFVVLTNCSIFHALVACAVCCDSLQAYAEVLGAGQVQPRAGPRRDATAQHRSGSLHTLVSSMLLATLPPLCSF